MAEIKSTLDLVLERTKHMTLTKEEREKQKEEEFFKSFNGLVQKFLDNVIRLEEVKKELIQLQQEHGFTGRKLILRAVLERMNFESDNKPLLKLLRVLCEVNTAVMEQIFSDYFNAVHQLSRQRTEEIYKTLAEKYHISGSAVIPNLEADQQWKAGVFEIGKSYGKKLVDEKERLM
jgi:hypothetical protein